MPPGQGDSHVRFQGDNGTRRSQPPVRHQNVQLLGFDLQTAYEYVELVKERCCVSTVVVLFSPTHAQQLGGHEQDRAGAELSLPAPRVAGMVWRRRLPQQRVSKQLERWCVPLHFWIHVRLGLETLPAHLQDFLQVFQGDAAITTCIQKLKGDAQMLCKGCTLQSQNCVHQPLRLHLLCALWVQDMQTSVIYQWAGHGHLPSKSLDSAPEPCWNFLGRVEAAHRRTSSRTNNSDPASTSAKISNVHDLLELQASATVRVQVMTAMVEVKYLDAPAGQQPIYLSLQRQVGIIHCSTAAADMKNAPKIACLDSVTRRGAALWWCCRSPAQPRPQTCSPARGGQQREVLSGWSAGPGPPFAAEQRGTEVRNGFSKPPSLNTRTPCLNRNTRAPCSGVRA